MKNSSVFDFKDFKEYLSERFLTVGNSRGMRIKFAQLIHASPSYVSKVLAGKIKLSLEYVPILNKLLEHNEQEAEYFMQTVLYTQAGSKDLELYFKGKLEAILDQRRVAADWIKDKHELEDNIQAKYTSQWYYTAIHVITLITAYQSKNAIAERLKISLSTVTSVLDYLTQIGLVEVKSDRYRSTKNRFHLKKDSEWIPQYHKTLRQYTIQKLGEGSSDDLHYSLVAALSFSDVDHIKKKIQKMLCELEPMMHTAKCDDIYTFSVDFLKI